MTYNKPDSCTDLQSFNGIPEDPVTIVVEAIGARSEDKTCPAVVTEETNKFSIDVQYDETYTFKFWQGEDSTGAPLFLTVEIPVK